MSALKRKFETLVSDSTDEASRMIRMPRGKASKGGKKRRSVTDDFNAESSIVDWVALAEEEQQSYKFDDKGLIVDNYLDFDEPLQKSKEKDGIKRYFVKGNGKDNSFMMLRDRSEVAVHFLCEIKYDIGCKKQMKKDEPNLTFFTQKLISKYMNVIFILLYIVMRFLTEL